MELFIFITTPGLHLTQNEKRYHGGTKIQIFNVVKYRLSYKMEHLNPDRFVIKCLRGRLCVFLSFIWTLKIPQIVVALTESLLIETIVYSTIALLYINGMSKLLGFYNFMYPFCVDEAMGNGIRYCPCSLSVIPAGWVVPYSIFFPKQACCGLRYYFDSDSTASKMWSMHLEGETVASK